MTTDDNINFLVQTMEKLLQLFHSAQQIKAKQLKQSWDLRDWTELTAIKGNIH